MNKQNFITLLKYRLANSTDSDLDAKIVLEMDLVQTDLLEKADFKPWFLLSENTTKYTEVGERRLPVPSNFLGEWEDGTLWRYDDSNSDDSWYDLSKEDYDYLFERYPGSGAPKYYALDGDYFFLFEQPDAEYLMRIKYYKTQTLPSALADSAENGWLSNASEWFMNEVGYRMATFHVPMPAIAAVFEKEAARAKTILYHKHIAREEERMHQNLGAA